MNKGNEIENDSDPISRMSELQSYIDELFDSYDKQKIYFVRFRQMKILMRLSHMLFQLMRLHEVSCHERDPSTGMMTQFIQTRRERLESIYEDLFWPSCE